MWVATDSNIGSDDDPIFFSGQRLHPYDIFHIRRELVSQVENLMVWFDHFIYSVREFRCEIVIEEKLHAASASSKSTAS